MSFGDILFGLVFIGGILYVFMNSNTASPPENDEPDFGEKIMSIEPEHTSQPYNIHYQDKI